MEYYVYYKAWPHKNLRAVQATANSAGEAIAEVAKMLKEEGEKHSKPLIAMIVGGKV